MELPTEVVETLLDTWPVARLATRGPDRPHLVPVVFARSTGLLWIPVDGKPKASGVGTGKPKAAGELTRVRHVRADPRVSLLLDHYDADWERLWWLRVDASARVVEPADPEADPEVAAAVAALRAKYPQYREVPVLLDPPTLLALRPSRRVGWRASAAAALS